MATRPARAGALHLRAVAGAATAVRENRLFFDQRRDRWDLPHLQVELSFADRVALELDYALWLVRWHDDATDKEPIEDGYASGDLRVRTRFIALTEGPRRPGIGIEIGAKLPNAEDRAGFGTDETDLHAGVLISGTFGPVELHGNAALAILGDPTLRAAQDDALVASGLVVVRPAPWLRLLVEVWGRPPSAANEGVAIARGGVGVRVGAFDVAVVAGVGMTAHSPRFLAALDLGFDGPLRPARQGDER